MTNKRFSGKWYIITVILALFSIKSTGVLSAAQQDTPGYVILSFDNISAEKGLKYLTDAKIGDVSHLPKSPTVFVTSSIPANLQKAEIIRDIVDCSQEYEIRFIPLTAKELPSGKQIANNIGTIAIGNFSNPPAKDGNARTVVDIRDDNVIIIAPSKKMDRIVNTIEKLQNTSSQNTSEQTTAARDSWLDSRVPNPESRLNTTPSLLAENVSKDIQDENNLNQRITDPAPIVKESFYQAKPVETKSNLLAENSLVDISNIPNPDDIISVTLPEQLTLLELIGLAGPNLHMDFMYNAGELDGNVTINPNGRLRGQITVRDLYNYLDTILQFKGFAMVRGPNNLVTIVSIKNIQDINPPFVQTNQRSIEAGDSVVIDTFELKYISTAAAKEFLSNMKLGIQITDIPENKKLMITEYTSRMPRIRALLDVVDRPGEKKLFRYRQLQHTEPQTLVPKIQSLAEKLNTVSITISTSSTAGMPEPPVRRDRESDASLANRMRQYELEVRRFNEANANRRPTTSTSSPGESTDPTVFIDSDERTNRILMIGLAKQLDDVEDLIDTLDIAQKDPRKLRIYKIEHLDAEEVLKQLQDLKVIPNNQETKDSSQSRTTQPSRITGGAEPREVTISPTPISSDQGDGDTLQAVGAEPLVVVTSTNSLLIIATEGQHERIASIIDLVDKEREEIPFKIFQLKNTGPEHVLSILEPLIEEKIRGPENKIESVVPKQDEQITIVADSNTSSLIVNANKKNQDWIESLIKVLDKRRPQVLIDVTLVQITKNDAFNYDLNLISSIPDLTNTSGLTSAILSSTSANLVEPLAQSSGTRSNFLDFQSNSGAGVGFYGDKHINALLTMMEEKDYGRVMAKPKILVNDNQLGKIESSDVIYVEKTSSTPFNASGTGSEPSLGTVTTSIDYDPYDTGVWLDITPHISESNLLRLDIRLERSDVTKLYTNNRPPDTTNSIVETTVTVPDHSTIILGGLTKLNQNKGGAKVPLLGDLPLIGAAFRKTRNSDNQRNLYVFVKAEIIRPPDEEGGRQEDLERISQINREAFERYEREFQEYQSFPGIKPTPMGPAKVLDTQQQ